MTTPGTRSRFVVRCAVIAVVGAVFVAPSVQARPHLPAARPPGPIELRDKMLAIVNRSRMNHGLPGLRPDANLCVEALGHTRKMAEEDRLFHTPGLAVLITEAGGTAFGEDLGKGRGLLGIRDAWLEHPDTRLILLDPRFRRAGLGVLHLDGFYWVTLQAFN
jgi:uncharacterized protein YkwD